MTVPADERRAHYEAIWAQGELVAITGAYADILLDPAANDDYAEFVRGKIRDVVDDPATAAKLCPTTYPIGAKRPCLDTGYYATFNRPDVDLVDLRDTPITAVTQSGIATADGAVREFDSVVLATGFDALTGAIVAVDIAGRDGVAIADRWEHGPLNYLGLMTRGFPNLFMITGPGSPSVFSNMAVSIEQHVDLVAELIARADAGGHTSVEPSELAESAWVQHSADLGDLSLMSLADSWYNGANVPGKPRVLLAYLGGVDVYRAICDEVAERGWLGFEFTGPDGTHAVDGVIRPLMPDVQMMLELMAAMDLPRLETLSAPEARAFVEATDALRPPGPDVGEVVDGTFPAADGGPLEYRLYRPATPGPHPVLVYFHGGGWVLGSAVSDDPLCRDLCAQSGAAVISMNYRHAPEARFPTATDDALAAVRWLADHGAGLGLDTTRMAVGGWSAGGNLAAVTAQRVRDEGGPALAGQVLLCPVTGPGPERPSYTDNGEGYVLTTPLMEWFWDHYAGSAGAPTGDPRWAPLGGDLSALPPAVVVTAEFDPLRDEGDAYAAALAAAGVAVEHIRARGQVRGSHDPGQRLALRVTLLVEVDERRNRGRVTVNGRVQPPGEVEFLDSRRVSDVGPLPV